MKKIKKSEIDETAYIAKGAVVIGNVTMKKDSSVWYNATVRSAGESISLGEGTNIQDNAVIHVDSGYPVEIGSFVTVGHGAIIHGCTIGDGSLIGMGAIILNGARIGKNCIVAAGALVTKGMVIPDGSLVMGTPAKYIRPVTEEEIQKNRENAQIYIKERLLFWEEDTI